MRGQASRGSEHAVERAQRSGRQAAASSSGSRGAGGAFSSVERLLLGTWGAAPAACAAQRNNEACPQYQPRQTLTMGSFRYCLTSFFTHLGTVAENSMVCRACSATQVQVEKTLACG